MKRLLQNFCLLLLPIACNNTDSGSDGQSEQVREEQPGVAADAPLLQESTPEANEAANQYFLHQVSEALTQEVQDHNTTRDVLNAMDVEKQKRDSVVAEQEIVIDEISRENEELRRKKAKEDSMRLYTRKVIQRDWETLSYLKIITNKKRRKPKYEIPYDKKHFYDFDIRDTRIICNGYIRDVFPERAKGSYVVNGNVLYIVHPTIFWDNLDCLIILTE